MTFDRLLTSVHWRKWICKYVMIIILSIFKISITNFQTILNLVMVLGFMACAVVALETCSYSVLGQWICHWGIWSYARETGRIFTSKCPATYKPHGVSTRTTQTEHIDNPKGYGEGEDARQYDPRLRGPVHVLIVFGYLSLTLLTCIILSSLMNSPSIRRREWKTISQMVRLLTSILFWSRVTHRCDRKWSLGYIQVPRA